MAKYIDMNSFNYPMGLDVNLRHDKISQNANNTTSEIEYTLYLQSMTDNVIMRGSDEIANAEKVCSEKQN